VKGLHYVGRKLAFRVAARQRSASAEVAWLERPNRPP
jgi:hypothetical protein